MHSKKLLWNHPLISKNFIYYASGQITSAFGDGLIPVTFTLAAFSLPHGGTILTWVLLALWGSRICCLEVGGSFADKYHPRTIMIWADITRSIVHCLLGISFYYHFFAQQALIPAALVYGIATAFLCPPVLRHYLA